MISEDRRKYLAARKNLKELIAHVGGHLLYMDSVMKGPSTTERGKAIAMACNRLDMAKQIAERYGLEKKRK